MNLYAYNTVGAAPVTVMFEVQVSGAVGDVSYYWAFGDGATATGGPAQTYTYQVPANYTVAAQVIDANGCFDGTNVIVNVTQPIPEFLLDASAAVAVGLLLVFVLTLRFPKRRKEVERTVNPAEFTLVQS
jgi:hypothetical protein